MFCFSEKQKPDIEYPCAWLYKVITSDRYGTEEQIAAMFQDVDCTIALSHVSSGGRYSSLDVEVQVASEEHRNCLYAALKELTGVRMVL